MSLKHFFQRYGMGLVLFVLGCAVFLPSLKYGLSYLWDDGFYIAHRDLSFSWEKMAGLWNDKVLGLWTPLATLSYMIDHAVWGKDYPMYHLSAILIHGITGVLFFRILRYFRIRKAIAWCAALLWMVHPCRVESVVWLAERKDVLSLLIAVISFSVFLHEYRKKQIPWKSLLLYLLALTAKPSVIGLPIVAGAYVFYRSDKRIPWKSLLTVAILCAAGLYLFHQRMGLPMDFYPFPQLLIVLFHNIFFYTVSAVIPVQPDFCYPLADTVSMLQLLPGVLILLSAAGIMARFSGISGLRFFRLVVCFGAAWAAFFAPISSLFIFNPTDYADRYTYGCSLVVIAFFAYLLHGLLKKYPEYRRIASGIFAMLLAFSLYRTFEYMPCWNNEWERVRRSFERYEFPNLKTQIYHGEFCITDRKTAGCFETAASLFHAVEEKHFYRPIKSWQESFRLHGEFFQLAGLIYSAKVRDATECMERIYKITKSGLMIYESPRYLPYIKQLYFEFLRQKKASPDEFQKFFRWCKVSTLHRDAVDDMIAGYYALFLNDYPKAMSIWKAYLEKMPGDVQVQSSYKALQKLQKEKPELFQKRSIPREGR